MRINQKNNDKNLEILEALNLMSGAFTRDIYKYMNPVLSRNKPRHMKEKREHNAGAYGAQRGTTRSNEEGSISTTGH